MPSVSKKQHNLMAAVANNPKFAKKVGIPQSVGEDFMEADKGKKFRAGGTSKLAGVNKPKTHHGKIQMPNYSLQKYVGKKEGGILKGNEMKESKEMMKKEVSFMKKKGAPKSMIKHEMAEAKGMKKGGYAAGGRMASKGEHPVQKQSKRGAMMVKMAAGGLAAGHKSADGIATKGKTKGKHVAMKKGGYC